MKIINKLTCMLLICIFSFNVITFPVIAEENITVMLNGETIYFDVPPQMINDRTMVPMRAIFEALGAKVEWVEEIHTIYAHLTPRLISLKIDDPQMYIMDSSLVGSGQSQWIITLDVPPIITEGRTLVPIRAVSEALNAVVEWDGDRQTIIIRKEEEVDINDSEIQRLFNNIINGDAFASYWGQPWGVYADVNIFDSEEENFSWMGGCIRELITFLSLKDVPNKEYTDDEAREIKKRFIADFGDNANVRGIEGHPVAIYKKSEIDEVSTKLFGKSLPETGSVGFPIAYGSFFLYNRTNLLEQFPITLGCNLYYNAISEEYMLTADESMLSLWGMENYLEYYNKHYEPLKSETQLLRATRRDDEISLYVYHEAEFEKYIGGTGVYKGEYRNTYRKGENGFYWVSSYGVDK